MEINEEMLVRHVLSLPQFRDLEPFEWELGSFEIEKHIIGNETIIKLTQKVNGIRVLGTEISLSLHNTTGEWTWARLNTGNKRLQKRQFGSLPSLDFTVSLTDVLGTLGPLLPPNVDPNTIYAEKVLIALPEVSAAWLVYDPQQSVLERTAYFVNAQTGKVFNLIHLATNDQAYVYPPKSSKPQIGTRPSVREIDNVNGTSTANGGFSIRGKDFRSFNTCFAYKCVTSPNTTVPADGSCDLDNVACVDPTPDMVLGRDYFTVNTTATYDAKLIDFWRDWAAEGYTGATIHVKWTNGTVFAPRLRKPDSGIWGSDIDFASYSTKDFTDSFSELQTYAYLTEHLGFLRELINDPTFCLIGSGPDCATIDPNTGLRADKNNYPMPFIVNLQQPGIDQSSFFDQLRSGKGKTVSNPILFPRFEGMGNAYFMRTITQKPLTNCTEGACVGTSKFQSSYLGFGQWFFDISLDNCIVFHELGHALVQKYIPLLPAYKRNTHGFVSVEPGALHEAWADYFAMINCGASGDWRTTASGIVTRNLNNQLTCQDFTGFHHYGIAKKLSLFIFNNIRVDSQIFSGALWAVRQTIGSGSSNEQRALDRAVLKALSTGKLTDDFSTQMGTILVLMKQDASLQPYASKAEEIFLERMLNCAQYIRVDKQTRLSIPNGAIPMATAPSAIRLFPKPSDWSVTLSWSQLVSIPSGQILTTGYAKEPINWAVARDCPLSIVGYTPYQNCSEVRLPLEWSPAGYDNLTGFTTFTTSFAVDAKFLEVAIYNPLTASLVLEYFSVVCHYAFLF